MTITIRNASYLDMKAEKIEFKLNNEPSILNFLLENKIDLEVIKTVTFLVNGTPAKYSDSLRDGDVLVVIPVIVGG